MTAELAGPAAHARVSERLQRLRDELLSHVDYMFKDTSDPASARTRFQSWVRGGRWGYAVRFILDHESPLPDGAAFEALVHHAVNSGDESLHLAIWKQRDAAYGSLSIGCLRRVVSLFSSQTARDIPQPQVDWYFYLAMLTEQKGALDALQERGHRPSLEGYREMNSYLLKVGSLGALWSERAPRWLAEITRAELGAYSDKMVFRARPALTGL